MDATTMMVLSIIGANLAGGLAGAIGGKSGFSLGLTLKLFFLGAVTSLFIILPHIAEASEPLAAKTAQISMLSLEAKTGGLALNPNLMLNYDNKFTLSMYSLEGREAEAPSYSVGAIVNKGELGSLKTGLLVEGVAESKTRRDTSNYYTPALHISGLASADVANLGYDVGTLKATGLFGTRGASILVGLEFPL